MINVAEQELITQTCLTLSQVSSSSNLVAASVSQAAQEQIGKAVTCLQNRIVDVVQQRGGLECLSAIEQDVAVKVMNIGGKLGGDLSNAELRFKDINHAFAARDGHLPYSLENEMLIMNLVKDMQNCYGIDARGNISYGKILPDGTQLWAEVRNNATIENCGFNIDPRPWNKTTGFKLLQAPVKKII